MTDEPDVPAADGRPDESISTRTGGSGDGEASAGADTPLAAVVAKSRADAAIESLRAEAVHDDGRHIREAGAECVAVPVTDPPNETAVREVVVQRDPDYRNRGLPDLLRERGFSEAEVDRAPGSWAVVGDVVLVRFGDCQRREAVGEALLDLHGEADTVLAREGVAGQHREPDVTVVAGSGDTETVHTEHGTDYALDLAEVMFSPGNEAERVRMGDAVAPGEQVLDMFAGIGYFTLPMARAGASVTAVERNPTAFRYLVENAALNDVTDAVEAIRADCRDVVPDVVPPADRVVMGHFDATERDYLDAAIGAAAPGGRLHVHAAVPEAEFPERPADRFDAAASAAGVAVADRSVRRIKSYSAGVVHGVLDATLGDR
ncbi:MAG: class I SAM-dependent methyltransferase family protein [Halobacteriaceae archaeon]